MTFYVQSQQTPPTRRCLPFGNYDRWTPKAYLPLGIHLPTRIDLFSHHHLLHQTTNNDNGIISGLILGTDTSNLLTINNNDRRPTTVRYSTLFSLQPPIIAITDSPHHPHLPSRLTLISCHPLLPSLAGPACQRRPAIMASVGV